MYVFSDSDCVNPVHRGAIVGGPAYAPRTSGPLDLPHSAEDLAKARGTVLKDGDGRRHVRPRQGSGHDVGDGGRRFRLDPVGLRRRQACLVGCDCRVRGCQGRSLGPRLEAGRPLLLRRRTGPGRPHRGRQARLPRHRAPAGRVPGIARRGRDPDRAKRVLAFGKNSADATPILQAIGLSPAGRLLMGATTHTSFYGSPLVTWDAAPAAAAYDVEWSRKREPVARRRAHPDPRDLGAAAGHRRHVVVSRPRHQPVAAG